MVAKQPTVAQRAFAVREKRETLLSAWYVTMTIMTSSESIEITAQAEEKADQYKHCSSKQYSLHTIFIFLFIFFFL